MNKSSIKCHHYRTVQRYNAKPNFKWRNVIYIDWTIFSYMVDVWGGLWCCAGATCSLLLGFRCQMFLHNFSLPDCSPIAFVSVHHSSYGKYFFSTGLFSVLVADGCCSQGCHGYPTYSVQIAHGPTIF